MDLSNLRWRKASRSASNGGDCVELATLSNAVYIRDSKDPEGPKLPMTHRDFRRFTDAIKTRQV
jgi:hypothetical protein